MTVTINGSGTITGVSTMGTTVVNQTLTTPTITSTMGVGNATPAASGAGITFPATQSASTDANTLDDYEEGTWTPALTSSGNTYSYTTRGGSYVKIGKQVICQFNIVTSGRTGAVANTLYITGLPFTIIAQSGGSSYPCQVVFGYTGGPTATLISGYGYDSQTQAVICKISGSAILDAVGTDYGAGQIIGQIIFIVA